MPIYDYSCTNCGHVVEVVHGVHEKGPTVCPNCGGLLRKQFSSPAIHFRGTGWAKKDARAALASRTGKPASDSGDKDGARAGRAGKSDSGGSDSGGSDSGRSDSRTKSDSGAKSDSGSGSDSSARSDGSGKGAGKSTSRGSDG